MIMSAVNTDIRITSTHNGTHNASGGGASGAFGGGTAGQAEPSPQAAQSPPISPLQGAVAAGASGGGTDDQTRILLAVSPDAMGTPTVLQVVPKVFRQTKNQNERLDLISPEDSSSKESRKSAENESRRYVTSLKSSRIWFWF